MRVCTLRVYTAATVHESATCTAWQLQQVGTEMHGATAFLRRVGLFLVCSLLPCNALEKQQAQTEK
jgi:hypothetical protein